MEAERLVRMNVERAATGQIGGQVADSVLLLAALADAEGDRAVATHLLLQMGVGNHAGTRMFSADLAVRLGVPEEHAAGVRRAITFHGSGAAAVNTADYRAARGARSPRAGTEPPRHPGERPPLDDPPGWRTYVPDSTLLPGSPSPSVQHIQRPAGRSDENEWHHQTPTGVLLIPPWQASITGTARFMLATVYVTPTLLSGHTVTCRVPASVV